MLSKYEIFGIAASISIMAIALYLVRVETTFLNINTFNSQPAQINASVNKQDQLREELENAMDNNGNLNKLIVDDVIIGTGEEVVKGDEVVVNYVGTLQNGTEFDNSKKRGEPFAFTVGEGRVIQGWEEGLIGMKVGGQRILVIPPEMGYGNRTIGTIPANSTLVFSIELLEIK